MKYFLKFIASIFRGLILYKRLVPAGLLGIFVVSQFLGDAWTKGLAYASIHLGKTLFSAELIINENVNLAISDSLLYDFGAFFQIVMAVMIFYFLIKWITKVFVKVAGSQAEWGAMLIAVFVVFILEISMVRLIDGSFGFFPIRDGLWYLLINYQPVLSNIHFFGI